VTGTTVANRIRKLEARGVIQGYYPSIDYEAAGYPLSVLFTCTVPLAERSTIAKRALDITGVTGVRETMASQQNVQVLVVGDSKSRIERLTTGLADLGLEIVRSGLLAHERVQPWDHFHLEALDDDSEGEAETADAAGSDTSDDEEGSSGTVLRDAHPSLSHSPGGRLALGKVKPSPSFR
jgi:DNA-binding Lrp family transcriptional regulator